MEKIMNKKIVTKHFNHLKKINESVDLKSLVDNPDARNILKFDELVSEINKIVGKNLTFDFKVKKGRDGRFRLEFSSQNLVDETGVLKCAFREIVVSNFNSLIIEVDGKIEAYAGIAFSYRLKDGGSNGIDIGTARFINGVWLVRTADSPNLW